MATEKLLTARVFAHEKFNDTESGAIFSSDELPNSGWTQLTTKGDVTISFGRETIAVGNDQVGDTANYIDSMPISVTVPLSKDGFLALSKYAQLDPAYISTANTINYSDNKGIKLDGLSMLIYAKDTDASNNTNTPDPTNDDNTQVFYNLIVDGDVELNYNNDQAIYSISYTAFAYQQTTSSTAHGYKGKGGTFTLSA